VTSLRLVNDAKLIDLFYASFVIFIEPPTKCPFMISRPPGWFIQTHKILWPYYG